MMKNHNYIIIFFLIFLSSCNSHYKYQCGWIVISAKYNDIDISEYITFGNLTINFDGKGTLADISYNDFEEYKMPKNISFKYFRNKGNDYIKITGSKFFNDTFQIECLNKECCRAKMWNDTKYLELLFNREGYPNDRRDCPSGEKGLEELKKKKKI